MEEYKSFTISLFFLFFFKETQNYAMHSELHTKNIYKFGKGVFICDSSVWPFGKMKGDSYTINTRVVLLHAQGQIQDSMMNRMKRVPRDTTTYKDSTLNVLYNQFD